eukprot:871686_1
MPNNRRTPNPNGQYQHYTQPPTQPVPSQSNNQRQSYTTSQRANHTYAQHSTQSRAQVQPRGQKPPSQQQGYKFGDLTKSVVKKGKNADGRGENSGYKFGDFTRGLFSG